MVLKIGLVQLKYFVDAPHSKKINAKNSEEKNYRESNSHITLESKGISFRFRPAEQYSVGNAIAHHVYKAENNQFGRSSLKTDLIAILENVKNRQRESNCINYDHHPG